MEEAKSFLKLAPQVERVIVESGIILLKYWLDVTEEEQTRRLKDRALTTHARSGSYRQWILKSYSRWYDYSRARDEMFSATDTAWAPWNFVQSDDKKRTRLNIISHLLSSIPYERMKRHKIELPKRQKPLNYVDPNYPYRLVKEVY